MKFHQVNVLPIKESIAFVQSDSEEIKHRRVHNKAFKCKVNLL